VENIYSSTQPNLGRSKFSWWLCSERVRAGQRWTLYWSMKQTTQFKNWTYLHCFLKLGHCAAKN